MTSVLRLEPYTYVHVEDNNTCEVFTAVGPLSLTLYDHLKVLHDAPQPCIVVPSNHYVLITNPVHRSGGESNDGAGGGCRVASHDPALLKAPKEVQWALGGSEYRFSQPPFPLFPGEKAGPVMPLRLLGAGEGLLLRRGVGEFDVLRGPGYYRPTVGEEVVREVAALQLAKGAVLHLRAEYPHDDPATGERRRTGDEWREEVAGGGEYFANPSVAVLDVSYPWVLTPTEALHVRATADAFDDVFQVARREGEEWTVRHADLPDGTFSPSSAQRVERKVALVVVNEWQYCVVSNPRDAKGEQQVGVRELRRGPCSFFVQPGERLDGGVRSVFVLSTSEALLVQATTAFTEEADGGKGNGTHREVSSRWLVSGPCAYIPPLPVRVLERRHMITLHQNEGVYVRNIRNGEVRCVYGAPFMLGAEEELWEKPVSHYIRALLSAHRLSLRREETPDLMGPMDENSINVFPFDEDVEDGGAVVSPSLESSVKVQVDDITPYAVVSANVEQNTLVRLYDCSEGTSRVVEGPAAVRLEPHEEFTPLCLSGGRPKKPDQIHALCLYLGPDYMADIIEVETLDHARLQLHLAYNWEFDMSDREKIKAIAFTVPDFIGEACKTLASRVRALIAGETFENFHLNSSQLIRKAIFSPDSSVGSTAVLRGDDALYFSANGLLITNVDVQLVRPVDKTTRQALTQSVQLAVEIITKSQESEATHNAMLQEQQAKGALELQVMRDNVTSEETRSKLFEVMVHNASIEQQGASKAQALAESKARLLEAQADLDATPVRCAAHEQGADAELEVLRDKMEADLLHQKNMNDIVIAKMQRLAAIEAAKYEAIMTALGKDTVVSIARSGPELQAKLLGALGLQGFLVTDGTTPINLTNLAEQITERKA